MSDSIFFSTYIVAFAWASAIATVLVLMVITYFLFDSILIWFSTREYKREKAKKLKEQQ